MAELDGQVALVTGGARRVGRAVALMLADHGMDVAITYQHSVQEAQELVERIEQGGRVALAIRVDLAQPDAAEFIYAQLTGRFDRLDVLVNNAAVFDRHELGMIRADHFDRQMAINARTPLLLTQRLAPLLGCNAAAAGAPSGRVVNFVDIHAMHRPLPGYAPYAASKAALVQITESLAIELAPAVTVNAIAPGVVDWAEQFTHAQQQAYLQQVPAGRAGTPGDAAAAVLFLVRDAPYCTGQIIRVDGGRWLA